MITNMINHLINSPEGAVSVILILVIVAVVLFKVNTILMNKID